MAEVMGCHFQDYATKKDHTGNSLVVQWLGLSVLTAEGLGFNPRLGN